MKNTLAVCAFLVASVVLLASLVATFWLYLYYVWIGWSDLQSNLRDTVGAAFTAGMLFIVCGCAFKAWEAEDK